MKNIDFLLNNVELIKIFKFKRQELKCSLKNKSIKIYEDASIKLNFFEDIPQ